VSRGSFAVPPTISGTRIVVAELFNSISTFPLNCFSGVMFMAPDALNRPEVSRRSPRRAP